MLCLPEGRAAAQQAVYMYICIYVYMYTVCTRAPGATARAGRQSWGQSACIKCSVTSQSWVVVSGKERGQQPEPFPGQAPGRCGGFGLSGPLLVLSRAVLGVARVGGCPHLPTTLEAAGDQTGLRFCAGPRGPARAQETDMAGDKLSPQGRETVLAQHQGAVPRLQTCPLQPTHGISRKGPAAGHSRQAPGRSGTHAGQQGPVNRAESLRSMHSLHLAMFSTSAWSERSCCSPSMSRRALW